MNEVGETADENRTFSTRSIVGALFGDIHKERLAKLKAEREQVQLENAITKGDFLNRQALEQAFVEIVAAMKQIVRASKLDRASQDDFLRSLASIKIVIKDAANRQAQVAGSRSKWSG